MYYLRARCYDPQIGCFTSFDIQEGTVDASQDLNRYVYCRNNPVKYVDPSGNVVYGTGGGASGGLALYGSLQGFYVSDDKGNRGFLAVLGIGGGLGVSASINGFTFPKMETIFDLKGFGGSAGAGFGVGGELQMTKGNVGVGVSAAKAGIDFHGLLTYSWLIEFKR